MSFEGEGSEPVHPLDQALTARLGSLVEQVTARWEDWDHAGALAIAESWFWGDFCDNYLELSKSRAYASDPSAIGTLRLALDVVLRLFAPVLPYITEEIYNSNHQEPVSIHRAAWPRSSELPQANDDGCFDAGVEVLTVVRKAKSEAKVSLRVPVVRAEVRGSRERLDLFGEVQDDVATTVNIKHYEFAVDDSAEGLTVNVELGEPERRQ
jgi:valyl-tRNA synthetase